MHDHMVSGYSDAPKMMGRIYSMTRYMFQVSLKRESAAATISAAFATESYTNYDRSNTCLAQLFIMIPSPANNILS